MTGIDSSVMGVGSDLGDSVGGEAAEFDHQTH
jgi:hypothetical protein